MQKKKKKYFLLWSLPGKSEKSLVNVYLWITTIQANEK